MAVVKYGAFVMNGEVDINNTVMIPKKMTESEKSPELVKVQPQAVKTPEEEMAELKAELIAARDDVKREQQALIKLKDSYIKQGTEVIRDAKKRADAIVNSANEEAEKIKTDTKTQCGAVLEQARTKGEEAGFKKGYDEGVEQCRAVINDVKQLLDSINREKSELFSSYEKEIFETVLEIVKKVTMDSLTAKDSRVITRIIKQAAKDFKNSDYIKLTLFKNDVNEELVSDIDFVRSLVGNIQNVEVELLPDVEEGTVILDNGSEITDASISTQLRMIAELGRGKYKDKPRRENRESEPTEAEDEKPRAKRTKKSSEE